jgi:hypothetical protein
MTLSEADAKALFEATVKELFQAERSATRHPRVESDRLGATPPGNAMDEIALHAEKQLDELDDIAVLRGIADGAAPKAIGRVFSSIRDNLTDLTTSAEQSYRLTLLGVRHGIDLVRLLRELAIRADDRGLKAWTEGWLLRRVELAEQAEAQLEWFAEHPARALAPVRSTPLAVIARSALRALG